MTNYLNSGQTRVVTDGMLPDDCDLTPPEVVYEIQDLGEVAAHEHALASNGAGKLGIPPYGSDELQQLGVAGWNGIYFHDGWWYAVHRTEGGGFSTGVRNRAAARAAIHRKVGSSIQFWMEKVEWRCNGDLTDDDDGRPVVRCGGWHYIIGEERDRGGVRGYGGRQFAFRWIKTGERFQSTNVSSQGRIPIEFRSLLPDNATLEVSDEQHRMDALRTELGRLGAKPV